jgi:putative intracellular protease/amidase
VKCRDKHQDQGSAGSHLASDYGDDPRPTGVWFEELSTPYFAFIDAGAEVDIASTAGGKIPVDPNSLQPAGKNPLRGALLEGHDSDGRRRSERAVSDHKIMFNVPRAQSSLHQEITPDDIIDS